ncbi:MAG: hypothetical protein ABIQ29_10055, partial [Burkholderiaceae bacterium]
MTQRPIFDAARGLHAFVGARRALATLCLFTSFGAASLLPAPVLAQGRELPDFTELVERVGPAVVNIRTSERARAAAQGGGEMDEQMREFFRRFGIP